MNGLGRQLFRDLPGSLGWGIVPPVPTPTRRPGPRPVEGALALAGWLVLAQGCGDPSPVNVFEQHAVGKALAPYGVTMSPVPEETASNPMATEAAAPASKAFHPTRRSST